MFKHNYAKDAHAHTRMHAHTHTYSHTLYRLIGVKDNVVQLKYSEKSISVKPHCLMCFLVGFVLFFVCFDTCTILLIIILFIDDLILLELP